MTKLIKKLISIIMICSIILPTNAAVSVSDGSLFISKAEHDADYNSLLNRVSDLKNSLNSRIDNVVSKYLKNATGGGGQSSINWQGEKQEICFDMGRFGYVYNVTSNYIENYDGNINYEDNYIDDYVMDLDSIVERAISDHSESSQHLYNAMSERRLVASCSKSGIATVTYEYSTHYDSPSGTPMVVFIDCFSFERPSSKNDDNYALSYQNLSDCLLYEANKYYYDYAPNFGELTTTVSFFVNKGDPIWFASYVVNPYVKAKPDGCTVIKKDSLGIAIY